MHITPQTSLETYEVGNKGKGKTKFTGYEDGTRGTWRICLPKNPLSSFSGAKVMLVVENAKRSVFFLRFFKKIGSRRANTIKTFAFWGIVTDRRRPLSGRPRFFPLQKRTLGLFTPSLGVDRPRLGVNRPSNPVERAGRAHSPAPLHFLRECTFSGILRWSQTHA